MINIRLLVLRLRLFTTQLKFKSQQGIRFCLCSFLHTNLLIYFCLFRNLGQIKFEMAEITKENGQPLYHFHITLS
jgi:hypothetical protein